MKKYDFIKVLIAQRKVQFISLMLFEILIWSFPLAEGLLLKKFFDSLQYKQIDYMSLAILVLLSLLNIFTMRIYFKNNVSYGYFINSHIKKNMMHFLLENRSSSGLQSSVGSIVNVFSEDVGNMEASVTWFSTVIGQLFRGIGALVILFLINYQVALFAVLPLLIVIIITNKMEGKIRKNTSESRSTTAKVSDFIEEMFSYVMTIKTSLAKNNMLTELEELNEDRYHAKLKESLWENILSTLYKNTTNFGTGIILLVSAYSISRGEFTIGDLSIFIFYLVYITDTIESVSNFNIFLAQTNISIENIQKKLGMPESINLLCGKNNLGFEEKEDENLDTNDSYKFDEIHVDSLSYHYPESTIGINSVSFQLLRGETICICGKTGAGKTTLLKCILGLIKPDEGFITVDGDICNRLQPPLSSYVSQNPTLLSDSIENNIKLGDNEVSMNDILYYSVLENDLGSFTNGLETEIGSNSGRVSGGQKHRIAIARMYARNSELLFMDDTTSALDKITEAKFWNRYFSSERTGIIVSNKKEILHKADKVIYIEDGEVKSLSNLNNILIDYPETCEFLL